MIKNRSPIQYAFFAAGGQSAVARMLGIPRQNVNSWFKRGFPVARCAELEALTHGLLNRQLLRPTDWHIHWPELAVMPATHPTRKRLASVDKSSVGV